MKRLLLTLILLGYSIVWGQNWVDLGNACWRVSPSNKIEGFTSRRNFIQYTADIKAPIILNDNNVLIFGLEHQHTAIRSNDPLFLDLDFGSSGLQIGWEHRWNERTKTLFMAIPRFNSNYSDVDITHFQLGGLSLTTSARSEKFDWKYGLYYNGELFAPMFVPLFGFNWAINEKWRFKMIVPINLEIAYMPKSWLRTGLRFDGVNASYKFESTLFPFPSGTYIDRADNNTWAFVEFHLGKNFWFHAKAGHSVLRKYRFFEYGDKMNLKLGPVNIGDNRNGDDPKAVPVLFKNGWSFETRLIYRLPI